MKNIDIVIKDNEEKILPIVWINGKEKEISVSAKLIGDNSKLTIVGIFLGTGASSIIFNTNVEHIGKNTKSLTTIRGVFKGNSSFNNDGMVHISNGSKGADGYFASKILLFDDAKGRSVPSLEIDENELKAGHASTVGRPDELQLFYLRARGLSEQEAEKLIISGFFEPLLLLLPKSQIKQISKNIQKVV